MQVTVPSDVTVTWLISCIIKETFGGSRRRNMKAITAYTPFYGDNLPILREHIPYESIDLVYLDPPFNSNRSYNVLFKEDGKKLE